MMRQVVDVTARDCMPDLEAVLHKEANGVAPPDRLRRLFSHALEHFERLAAPAAMIAETTTEGFAAIYRGEGLNAPSTPLAEIYPRAQKLAVFAATVGDDLSEEIGLLFKRDEPALGYALDVLASEATNTLAEVTTQRFRSLLLARGAVAEDVRVLPYSPGYCGWHVSGQRRLFEALQPAAIGIRLGSSFLMRPLKSVSGVIVAGPPAVHRFRPTYPFCDDCTTHECRGRMASVLRVPR
jgi:hypothetical protein